MVRVGTAMAVAASAIAAAVTASGATLARVTIRGYPQNNIDKARALLERQDPEYRNCLERRAEEDKEADFHRQGKLLADVLKERLPIYHRNVAAGQGRVHMSGAMPPQQLQGL